jgi:hypothetical protein
MHPFRHILGGLACALALAACARADAPPSPLRLVPDQADFVVQVHQPRRLVETATSSDLLKQVRTLDAFKEFFDSTNYRRFYQLVAYVEKELGMPWPQLLDRLAGGGMALGVKAGSDPAPSLLVIQGSDEELTKKFARLALEVIQQERARQESKDRIERATYRNVEVVGVGKEFRAAQIGSTILISNNDQAMKRALDLHAGGKGSLAESKSLAEAQKLVPAGALATAWLSMENVRRPPEAAATFRPAPRDNQGLTVLFGGLLDVAGRAPFLAAGLYREKDDLLLTVRAPAGRDGMGPDAAVHVPPHGAVGTLPLLEPRGVLFSGSYYYDVGKFWDDRAKLFPDNQVKQFEEFDKNSGRFLAGNKFSTLLTQAGPRQRLVVVNQPKVPYKVTPKQSIPAFAVVAEMRKPDEFARSLDTVLRGAALLAGTQVKFKLVEEKHAGCDIVGYRFDEDAPFKQDVNDVRFNFSPCYVRVGDQFIAASTLELGRELVDLLQNEQKAAPKGSPAASRDRLYGTGGAELLKVFEPQLIAQTVLDQATTLEEATKQVRALIALVGGLGDVQLDLTYDDSETRYDLRVPLK